MTSTTRPQLDPITCKPWCKNGDGHADAWHPDDQWCGTRAHLIGATLYPPAPMTDGTRQPEFVRVYAEQDPADPYAVVHLSVGDDDTLRLTVHEAAQLRDALAAIVREVSA